MRKRIWLPGILVGLVVAGLALSPFKRGATAHEGGRASPRATTATPEALTGEAASRFRNCQPNHWRAMMLQRSF
jgi:hypothetical protein